MRTSTLAVHFVVFALSAIVGISYVYGDTCTHKDSDTCPGYGAANAINGNCCNIKWTIPVDCGIGAKDVTEHPSVLCGVLAPVNAMGQCGTETSTGCGQKRSAVGCTTANCE